MKSDLTPFIKSTSQRLSALKKIESYRRYDPGWYLYRQLLKKKRLNDKLSKEGVELIYVTLCAWNMNSRGAKLADLPEFYKSIIRNKIYITPVETIKLSSITRNEFDQILKNELKEFFFNAELVATNKPRIITYSKALHFLLPNLIVPIDRKYTLQYFYHTAGVPKSIDRQYQKFCDIQQEFRRFSQAVDLSEFIEPVFNPNIPKLIDNMIIGSNK